ncbi:DinB family protein [bacterium]|nr:MAG: DinB family protein [bacterium]
MEVLMQETPQQYTERILGYQQGQQPLSVMALTPKKLARLLKGKSRAALNKRPEPDKWSIAEVLAHLADAELAFSWRIRLTLGANGTLVQAYDQDAWAAYSNYPKHDPKLSLDAYRIQRERNVQLLRLIPKEMWENFGMHEERGKESVTRLTEMMAGHDINHLRQVEGMAKSKKKRTSGSKSQNNTT